MSARRGAQHHRARLTDEQVDIVRRLRANEVSWSRVARAAGCSIRTARDIAFGITRGTCGAEEPLPIVHAPRASQLNLPTWCCQTEPYQDPGLGVMRAIVAQLGAGGRAVKGAGRVWNRVHLNCGDSK